MSILTIELPSDLDARLEAVAASRQIGKAQLVREMIEARLPSAPIAIGADDRSGSILDRVRDLVGKFDSAIDRAAPAMREGRIVPRPGSALELAGDLVGCIEGPGDLTTNPKYMEDYGR